MNLSQFKPFKQYSFLRQFKSQPNIREGNPVVKRDPTVLVILERTTQNHLNNLMHQFTHCTSHKHYISLHSGKITTLKLVSCSSKCSSRCQWSPTVKIFHIFYDNQLFITIFITIQDEEVQYCIFSQGLKKNHNTHS